MVASTIISIAFTARNTTTTHGGRRAIERQGRLREWCQCSQVGSKLGEARGEISLRSQIGDRCGESRHSASVPCAGAGVGFDQTGWRSTCPFSSSGALIAIAS